MNPVRYGIIGTGMMGQEHIGNLLNIDDAVVTALADPHQPSIEQSLQLVPDAAVFSSHQELIEADVCDAVVIATPNMTHVDIMLDVLATELNVLVEKPLCTTVEDCHRVIEAAVEHYGLAWVGLEYRYMPPTARLIEEVRSGTVGSVKSISIREHRFPFLDKVDNWNRFNANSGGTLVEKCCHFFDIMNLIANDRPKRVLASGSQAVCHLDESYDGRVPDILDNAYVIVEYESGVRAMLDLCMFAEATHNQNEVTVVGDTGKVEASLPDHMLRIGRRGTHWIGNVESMEIHDDRIGFVGGHHGSSYLEHLDFIKAVRHGRPTGVGLVQGMLAVAVGVAGQLSIDENRWVHLAEVL